MGLIVFPALMRRRATGGVLYDGGTEYVDWVKGYESRDCTLTKGASYMTLTTPAESSSEIAVVTDSKVDLTNWNSVEFHAYWTSTSNWAARHFIVSSAKNNSRDTYDVRVAYLGTGTESGNIYPSLDVSALSGEYYIRAHQTGSKYSSFNMRIYKVWLE